MAPPVLVPISQKGPLKEIPISSNRFSIGRRLQNEFVVEDVNVSRTHCVFEYLDNKWTISDISSNGTWLNGHLLGKGSSHVLATGDVIGLSESLKYVFKSQSDEGSRIVGISTNKKTFSESEILNIADSVIADVAAFEAECAAENFAENVFDNATPGSSLNTINPINNTSAEGNNLNIPQPQPIMAYVIQPCAINVKENLSAADEVLVQPPVDGNSSAVTSLESQLNIQQPSNNLNVPAPPQKNNLDFAEDELQCSICTEMFVQAVTLSCSHTFCKHCIVQWQNTQTFCPICRQKITLQFPTRVIDNYIEKIIENASDDIKQHRQELIEQRQTETATPAVAATASASTSTERRRGVLEPIEISSAEENDDDEDTFNEDDYDEEMSDYSGTDSDDDAWSDYNGVPHQYYGGYGHCFSCGQKGHWANGCPNRRR